jgi:hypothetical protein
MNIFQGSSTFDPVSQVCCNGKTKTGRACCASDAFDPLSQVCCNGKVTAGVLEFSIVNSKQFAHLKKIYFFSFEYIL